MEVPKIILWIMISLIILITLFLCVIYIISKSFRSYPCYLNIILSFVILMDNILRLIKSEGGWFCGVQAFCLAVFDKLMLIVMTINAYLTYVGFNDNEFYKQHIKKLFIISNVIGLLVSVIFGIVFISIKGVKNYSNVCYVKASDIKESTDIVITIILAAINFFCIVGLLLRLVSILQKVAAYRKVDDFVSHYHRIILSLFINSATFLLVILIISDSLFGEGYDDYIDLCYIIDALIVDLFYTCNATVINEVKKLFGIKSNEGETSEEDLSRDNSVERTDSLTDE